MEDKDFTIENRLREIRKSHKLSQEELAQELNISRQSIISLEQGHSMPSLPLAVSLCRFFDSAFEEMFEFERDIESHIESNLVASPISIKVINPARAGVKERDMNGLEPWRPFHEAVSLRDAMDRLLEDSFITPTKGGGSMPKIDIKDEKGMVVVKAELPGIAEEDINVEILDNIMTISGEKKGEKEVGDEKDSYYYKESHTGSFSRAFTLPSDVMAEKAVAEMKNGILTISVPKVAPKKALKVKVAKK